MRPIAQIALALAVIGLIGCGGTPPAEVTPSPDSSPPSTAVPTASPSPAATPAASPSPSPTDAAASPTPATPLPASPQPTPASSPTAAPGGAGWQGPERISERAYYQPSMIVDAGLTDIVHVAAGLGRGIFHVTNDVGNVAGAWTRERLTDPPRRNVDEQPSLAMDPLEGDLYVAFTRMYDSELGRFPEGIYLVRRPVGGDWSSPRLLVGEGAHSPSLQVRGGRLYLAYVANAPSDVIEDDPHHPLMYGTDHGGAFASTEIARNGGRPQLLLDEDGRPHILFASPWWAELGVSYGRGSGPAGTFSLERLPGTNGDERMPALALDAAGRPHAVWNLWPHSASQPTIYYARRGGSGWTTPRAVIENALASAIVVDATGTVHVAAGGERGVLYATDVGGSFSSVRLSSEPTLWLNMVQPEGGATSPQVHLLFVTGHDDTGNGLWYGVGRPD
jgi:hypothetical protein